MSLEGLAPNPAAATVTEGRPRLWIPRDGRIDRWGWWRCVSTEPHLPTQVWL